MFAPGLHEGLDILAGEQRRAGPALQRRFGRRGSPGPGRAAPRPRRVGLADRGDPVHGARRLPPPLRAPQTQQRGHR